MYRITSIKRPPRINAPPFFKIFKINAPSIKRPPFFKIFKINAPSIKRPPRINAPPPQRGCLFETFCYFPGKNMFVPCLSFWMRTLSKLLPRLTL